ncbi:MAG: tellurite resistance TerB family protein [Myxococcaceae bacterium]
MSTIRHLFTARTARPKLEASMRAITRAAIYLASADGAVQEAEIEALVDDVRDVVARSVGIENVDEYAKVTMLLDDAREALRALGAQGRPAFVEALAKGLEGDFKRDALKVALDVVQADGRVTEAEQRALEELSRALGVQASELAR